MKNFNKIFIVTNNAWYAYNFRLNLAIKLKQNGYIVSFLAPFDKKYSNFLKKEFELIDINIDSQGINPLKDIKTLIELYKIYKSKKPNIVLNFTIKPNIYSSLICRILKIPCISNITGLGTIFIKENFITKIVKFLYKFTLAKNNIVFFQNQDDKELFLKFNLLKNVKVDILPGSGVDLEKFRSTTKIILNEKFIFLYIGRLIKDKGVIELIEAVQLLRQQYNNFELHLLGELGVKNNTAISKNELDSWLENKYIKYLGKTDIVQDEIIKVDCVVLPSYREGTPRSLLEAAAMEKVIVTTNTIGCKDVVDDGINGYLCEVMSSKDLANKMEKILNLSLEERIFMGKNGRKKMLNQFDEKIVINKYLENINEILK